MPLVLRDRLSVFAIVPIFLSNIVLTGIVFTIAQFSYWAAAGVAWVYVYVLLIQTRLMAFWIGLGGACAIGLGYFTSAYRFEIGVYVVCMLAVASLLAHILAVGISALTGFRV